MMSESKLVQIKMSESTLHQLDDVKRRINAETVTGTIRSSIAMADMITKAMSKGEKVFIQNKEGEKYLITMPWLAHG